MSGGFEEGYEYQENFKSKVKNQEEEVKQGIQRQENQHLLENDEITFGLQYQKSESPKRLRQQEFIKFYKSVKKELKKIESIPYSIKDELFLNESESY